MLYILLAYFHKSFVYFTDEHPRKKNARDEYRAPFTSCSFADGIIAISVEWKISLNSSYGKVYTDLLFFVAVAEVSWYFIAMLRLLCV